MITGIVFERDDRGKVLFREAVDTNDRKTVERKLIDFVREQKSGWFYLRTEDENGDSLSLETVEVYGEEGEIVVEQHTYDSIDDWQD